MAYPYVPPKPVSAPFEATMPPLPKAFHYWWLCTTIAINVPEEEPNTFTGPKGRLKWISPIHLQYHDVTPACDVGRGTKEKRLHDKGWQGISVYHYSGFERRAIIAHLDTLGTSVYRMRPYTMRINDERPGDIGSFVGNGQCFYLETEALRGQFKAMLDALPQRTIEMYIDRTRLTGACWQALRGFNHMVTAGEDADLLTVEERVDSTVLMMIKMTAGVEKPS